MTVTIEIPGELGAALDATAKRSGVSRDVFVQKILQERLRAEPAGSLSSLPITPRIPATNLPVKDRPREHEWLARHRDEYDGQWVALDGDRLLAHGDNLKEVATKAHKKGVKDALLVRVEGSNTLPYVGGIW